MTYLETLRRNSLSGTEIGEEALEPFDTCPPLEVDHEVVMEVIETLEVAMVVTLEMVDSEVALEMVDLVVALEWEVLI